MLINFIERATFSGSSHSTVSGLPVLTPQKPQERVHIFPRIINVAVPSPQHSPMFGQLPLVQIVFNLYLSTKLLNSVYFLPTGNFTRNHLGFLGLSATITDSISIFLSNLYANIQRKVLNTC